MTWKSWPLERVLYALAGIVTLASVALAMAVSPWFLVLAAFVGASEWLFFSVGHCPAPFVLEHFLVSRRACSRG